MAVPEKTPHRSCRFGVQLRDFGERVLQRLLIDVELFLDALEVLFENDSK